MNMSTLKTVSAFQLLTFFQNEGGPRRCNVKLIYSTKWVSHWWWCHQKVDIPHDWHTPTAKKNTGCGKRTWKPTHTLPKVQCIKNGSQNKVLRCWVLICDCTSSDNESSTETTARTIKEDLRVNIVGFESKQQYPTLLWHDNGCFQSFQSDWGAHWFWHVPKFTTSAVVNENVA